MRRSGARADLPGRHGRVLPFVASKEHLITWEEGLGQDVGSGDQLPASPGDRLTLSWTTAHNLYVKPGACDGPFDESAAVEVLDGLGGTETTLVVPAEPGMHCYASTTHYGTMHFTLEILEPAASIPDGSYRGGSKHIVVPVDAWNGWMPDHAWALSWHASFESVFNWRTFFEFKPASGDGYVSLTSKTRYSATASDYIQLPSDTGYQLIWSSGHPGDGNPQWLVVDIPTNNDVDIEVLVSYNPSSPDPQISSTKDGPGLKCLLPHVRLPKSDERKGLLRRSDMVSQRRSLRVALVQAVEAGCRRRPAGTWTTGPPTRRRRRGRRTRWS